MALSALGLVFYAAVLLSAFTLRSAAGFGAGLIAIPMLALILPVSTAVSVATVLTTVTSAGQVSREWRHVAWRQFALIFFYSMAGIGLPLQWGQRRLYFPHRLEALARILLQALHHNALQFRRHFGRQFHDGLDVVPKYR